MNEVNLDAEFASIFPDLADDAKTKPEGFESPLSPNIYDAAPDERLVQFIEPLIGDNNYKVLLYTANQRGVSPLTCLRQVIAYAFINGSFDCNSVDGKVLPEEKRNGNDNDPKFTKNMQMRGVIRQHNYNMIASAGHAAGISNIVALRRGLAAVLDTDKVMVKIQDSEKAMKALERRI